MDLELLLLWLSVLYRYLFGTMVEKLEADVFIAQAVYGEEIYAFIGLGAIALFVVWAIGMICAIRCCRKGESND